MIVYAVNRTSTQVYVYDEKDHVIDTIPECCRAILPTP